MKKKLFRLIALTVALCIFLGGCSLAGLLRYNSVPFKDMVYTRPDLSELNASVDKCIQLTEENSDFDGLWSEIINFFTLFSDFSTQYLLSYVHYCKDLRDLYWTEEYNYCEERTAQVDAARDRLLRALAKSDFREQLEGEAYFGADYFQDYDGESIWTDTFQALKEQESELVGTYYQIYQEGAGLDPSSDEYYDSCGLQLEELYLELVAVRQQLAQEAGFANYSEYAYQTVYYRDYTDADAQKLCQQIAEELVPLYLQLAKSGFWNMGIYEADEQDIYRYVRTAASNMGGQVQDAFQQMSQNKLYDISFGEYKLEGAFEVYFYDYEQPYVFLSPTGTEQDCLSFAHEFGHFCNDYVSFGSMAGIDASEVFSQGMEYLSLTYANPSEELALTKLGDALCTYVEQAAYSSFEQQVYGLSPEQTTVENVRALFQQTCESYGLDYWQMDGRDYASVTHFFTQPLYVISYVVSNDAAFQLYQLEQQETGAGLQVYTANLGTMQEDFLPFLEEAGLESPFREGRIQTVKETFQKALF